MHTLKIQMGDALGDRTRFCFVSALLGDSLYGDGRCDIVDSIVPADIQGGEWLKVFEKASKKRCIETNLVIQYHSCYPMLSGSQIWCIRSQDPRNSLYRYIGVPESSPPSVRQALDFSTLSTIYLMELA